MGKRRTKTKPLGEMKKPRYSNIARELDPFKIEDKRIKEFVYYYISGGGVKSSLAKAGFEHSKCTEKFAKRLLEDPRVFEMLQKGKKLREEEIMKASVMSVVERQVVLSELARGDLSDYVDISEEGRLRLEFGKNSVNRRSVRSIKINEGIDKNGDSFVNSEIKLADPVKAIDTLNKMDGLYQQNVNIKGDIQIVMDEADEGL